MMPNLLGQSAIVFEDGQATLAFDAGLPYGSHEKSFLSGTQGSLHSYGSGNQEQELYVATSQGRWFPELEGKWFPNGLRGTMGELLCAIEEERPSSINARDNLKSLELCFAAIQSAEIGQSVVPGSLRTLPGTTDWGDLKRLLGPRVQAWKWRDHEFWRSTSRRREAQGFVSLRGHRSSLGQPS